MYLAVIAAGLFAGFVNTLAGSGSLITLPLLMFLGLPANIANGTNRIGVFVQSLVSSISFKSRNSIPSAKAYGCQCLPLQEPCWGHSLQ